jgi:hypothetical protein
MSAPGKQAQPRGIDCLGRNAVINEGPVDRILRILFGAAILSLAFFGPKTLWGLIGLIPILTGIVGMCPIYSLLGIRTTVHRR